MNVELSPVFWFNELWIDPFIGILIALISLFIVFGAGTLAGYLKKEKGIRSNYSRKVFHFIVFTTATIIQWQFGLPGTAIFGTCSLFFLIVSMYRGEGSIIYEGIAREQDRPHRSFYLIVPFIATALGGITGNFFFMGYAMVGYLVIGWGDAVGEPFGVKFGKHKYRVFTLTGIKCHRSIEGSIAVFVASSLAATFVLANPVHGVIIGLIAALLESQSPHGGDNFIVQLGATTSAFMLAWMLPMGAFW